MKTRGVDYTELKKRVLYSLGVILLLVLSDRIGPLLYGGEAPLMRAFCWMAAILILGCMVIQDQRRIQNTPPEAQRRKRAILRLVRMRERRRREA